MIATVTTENRKLIETVSVLATAKPVRIELSRQIIVEFEFEKTEDEKRGLKLSVEDNVLKVHLKNFDGSLGSSTIEPIEIGNYQGKKLYIHFSVHGMGNDIKLLVCSFWGEI